jgi:arylsulfatase A-like enzyme
MSATPDVLLIVMDAVRAQSVGAYGCTAQASPRLDALAAKSRLYTRAHSTSCWTLPAHASLFTGLETQAHRMGADRWSLGEVDQPTLAERFRDRGYATVAASANPWVGPGFGFDRGFDTFIAGWQVGALPDLTTESLLGGTTRSAQLAQVVRAGPRAIASLAPGMVAARRRRSGHAGSSQLLRRFLDAWSTAARTRPVFGFVNLLDAHLPRQGSPHPWEYIGGIAPRGDRRAHLAAYHAAVRSADHHLGRLLDAVDRLDRPTTVVITADHGENVGEHGLMDHQFSLHQTVLHVPLVVRDAGGADAGEREPGLVSLADIPQALIEGCPVSTRASVSADYPYPQPPIERLRARFPRGAFDRFDRSLRAVLHDDGRKLIWASDGEHEAYRLTSDPGERQNLWPSPELAVSMARMAPGNAADTGRFDAVDDDLTTRAALAALGYL